MSFMGSDGDLNLETVYRSWKTRKV